jgi:hypothetical protein
MYRYKNSLKSRRKPREAEGSRRKPRDISERA